MLRGKPVHSGHSSGPDTAVLARTCDVLFLVFLFCLGLFCPHAVRCSLLTFAPLEVADDRS